MASKRTNKSTGPRTAVGKAKSSKNAVSHGLTSTRVLPDEVQMVEDFVKELTDYYRPDSPLEVLQIQRIALNRAKLAKFMDIEVAGREVQRKLIEIQPELVINKLTQFPQVVRDVALKTINGHSMLGELGLYESALQSIKQEILECKQTFGNEDELPAGLPKLSAYLSNAALFKGSAVGLDCRLVTVAQKVKTYLEPPADLKNPGSFDELLLSIHSQKEEVKQNSRHLGLGAIGYNSLVRQDLNVLVKLADIQSQVGAAISGFEEMKGWMLRSVDLSSEESERMMKYQTALERRLSTAIGELLELQKHRPVA